MSSSIVGMIMSKGASFIADEMSLKRIENPFWLDSMSGESPLLEPAELEFIAEVRNRIIQEAKPKPTFLCENPLQAKLTVLKDNFVQVVEYLKVSSQSREYFIQIYPEWWMFRNQTIKQLKDIAKAVNIDNQKSAESRIAGSTVSLIGGVICLATGALALRIAGSILMGLGSLASAGAAAEEVKLLRKKIKVAEKIIQEDKGYSEKMWNWISDVSYIQKALNIIRDIDVDRNLKKAADELHDCFKEKRPGNDLTMLIKGVLDIVKISPYIVKEICDVVGLFIAFRMLHDRYRTSFNLAFEAYKCEKVLGTVCDIIASVKVTSAFTVCKSSKLTKMQKFGIGIGIASDLLNILHAAESAESMSKEAKGIIKAAETLKKEADIFKKLFEAAKYS